jgi:catechol 2,3-dioxygenase-like lactoylglutathione lyase family enzyme/transposase-like protein
MVDQVRDGRRVKELVAESGVAESTVHRWVRQDRIDRGELVGTSTAESAQLSAARRRIAELEADLATVRRTSQLAEGWVVRPKALLPIVATFAAEGHGTKQVCRLLGLGPSPRAPWPQSVGYLWCAFDRRYAMFASTQFRASLPASDIDRASAWYRDVLGLEPVDTDPMGNLWYEAGGSSFLLYPSEFAGTNKATAVTLKPEDFDAAIGYLRGKGVAFQEFDYGEMATVDGVLTAPNGDRAAWFSDSEGNIIAVSTA